MWHKDHAVDVEAKMGGTAAFLPVQRKSTQSTRMRSGFIVVRFCGMKEGDVGV